jgi:hypothetical protein
VRPRLKVWIETEDGRVALSEWRVGLLTAVAEHGQLSRLVRYAWPGDTTVAMIGALAEMRARCATWLALLTVSVAFERDGQPLGDGQGMARAWLCLARSARAATSIA